MTHVRMWEARCEEGRTDAAVTWVRDTVAPAARAAGATLTEVFRTEDRVVLISRWPAPTDWVEPQPDPAVVARAHAWPFEQV